MYYGRVAFNGVEAGEDGVIGRLNPVCAFGGG
jgi:hypothetical protein